MYSPNTAISALGQTVSRRDISRCPLWTKAGVTARAKRERQWRRTSTENCRYHLIVLPGFAKLFLI
jgi:hypothetical protein